MFYKDKKAKTNSENKLLLTIKTLMIMKTTNMTMVLLGMVAVLALSEAKDFFTKIVNKDENPQQVIDAPKLTRDETQSDESENNVSLHQAIEERVQTAEAEEPVSQQHGEDDTDDFWAWLDNADSHLFEEPNQVEMVLGGYSEWYKIPLEDNERTSIIIDGDGDTDLDLYIYDENLNIVCQDTNNSDYCICTFTPIYTGYYYIKVENLGEVKNYFKMVII